MAGQHALLVPLLALPVALLVGKSLLFGRRRIVECRVFARSSVGIMVVDKTSPE